jgi:threonine aldolase
LLVTFEPKLKEMSDSGLFLKSSFASDNNSGVHPSVLQALADVNQGYTLSYGEDAVTLKAEACFKKAFETDCDVFFALNGTGANVLALSAILPPYGAIVCSSDAHIHTDECGAPERLLSCKLYTLPVVNGKLTTKDLEQVLHFTGSEHHAQPKVLSITEVTELGTVYTAQEIKELCTFAKKQGWKVHLDGSRLSNAVASTGSSLAELSWKAGVDILSFGGTKNGLMLAEAVVVFDKEVAGTLKYLRKQCTQLVSKMRFVSSQFLAYFENDLWLSNAQHSNKMAQRLAKLVSAFPEIELCYPVQANAIFARIPTRLIEPLQRECFFYVWNEQESSVRWMTSFDTKEEDILQFVKIIEAYLK